MFQDRGGDTMNSSLPIFVGLLLWWGSDNAFAQDMPQEIQERIKRSLGDRYPDNYSMQKTFFDV